MKSKVGKSHSSASTHIQKPKQQHITNVLASNQFSSAWHRGQLTPNSVMFLQRTVGNQATQRLLKNPKPSATTRRGPVKQVHNTDAAMPDKVRLKMEESFGADLSDVRITTHSIQAQRMGALAFTHGNAIHFAPGQYHPHTEEGQTTLGHELTHVLQQRAGRVGTLQMKSASVGINLDSNLEAEADTQGARAARGDSAQVVGDISRRAVNGTGVIQPKLGFEIEMLALVDIDGRPPPEKAPLGKVGNHLNLEVDQNSKVASPTPTTASTGSFNLPHKKGGTTSIGAYDLPPGWQRGIAYRPDTNTKWRVYANEAALPVNQPDTAETKPLFRQGTGDWVWHHPLGPGMGMDNYASIVEIVTKAYAAETDQGKQNLINAMTDAAQFAADVESETNNFQDRVKLGDVNNVDAKSDAIYIGNDQATDKQSTEGSIQSTLGLDLSEMGSFIKSTMGFGSQGIFSLKHHSDTYTKDWKPVDRVLEEVPLAVRDATAIINEIGHKYKTGLFGWGKGKTPDLTNMRGLLIMICQYLRMGRYFYEGDRPLDKNIVPLLSRTNLSAIFQGLPADDRTWLKKHKKKVLKKIYAHTKRTKSSTVFTNKDQSTVSAHNPITVEKFVKNIFGANDDGITSKLGGFHKMGMEDIDPEAKRPGSEAHKVAPVFEMRNLIPKGIDLDSDRFPRTSWVKLGTFMANIINKLNKRTDDEAKQDMKVRANTGTGNIVGETTEDAW